MNFRVEIYREDSGVAVMIEEDSLEAMFQPRAQVMILEAYAKHIEEKSKIIECPNAKARARNEGI